MCASLQVTLQSFLWSKRLAEQGTEAAAKAIAATGEDAMTGEPMVSLDNVFQLRQGIFSIATLCAGFSASDIT